MDSKHRQDIALFHYSLIAPLITNTFTQLTMKIIWMKFVQKLTRCLIVELKHLPPKLLKVGCMPFSFFERGKFDNVPTFPQCF